MSGETNGQSIQPTKVDAGPTEHPTSVTPRNETLTTSQMSAIADSVIRSFSDEPTFVEAMPIEQRQARVLVSDLLTGVISSEEAEKIIATGRAELAVAAGKDLLTGLSNRAETIKRLSDQITTARRSQKPITVGFFDLDNFKFFNDTHKQKGGDIIINATARYLETSLRRGIEHVGRMGGDEFIITLPETNEETAYNILRDLGIGLDQAVSQVVLVDHLELSRRVTVSIGFATVTIDRTDPRSSEDIALDLIDDANGREKLAKKSGKDKVIGPKQETALLQQE